MELSRQELIKILSSKVLRPEQEKALQQVLSIETYSQMVKIPDGFKFLRDLKKEAKRQEKMKKAELLELQARNINHVPEYATSTREEVLLAESFDIIEE